MRRSGQVAGYGAALAMTPYLILKIFWTIDGLRGGGLHEGAWSHLNWAVGRWLVPLRRRNALVTLMALDVGIGVVAGRTHWLSDVLASLFLAIPLLWATLRVGFTRPRITDGGHGPGPRQGRADAVVGAIASPERSESDGCPAG